MGVVLSRSDKTQDDILSLTEECARLRAGLETAAVDLGRIASDRHIFSRDTLKRLASRAQDRALKVLIDEDYE